LKVKVNRKLNSSGKFVVFYVVVISVALVSSLYAGHFSGLPYSKSFTFASPPSAILNDTCWINITLKFFPAILEIAVKVNDDDCHPWGDTVSFIFDSDHNGVFRLNNLHDFAAWCSSGNLSYYFLGFALEPDGLGGFRNSSGVLGIINDSKCIYTQGQGYAFTMNIPRNLTNLDPPILVHMIFIDKDVIEKVIWGNYDPSYTYKSSVMAVTFEA